MAGKLSPPARPGYPAGGAAGRAGTAQERTAPARRASVARSNETGPAVVPAGPVVTTLQCGAETVDQTVNELPQPQPPVAFGFLNVKPEPIMVVT